MECKELIKKLRNCGGGTEGIKLVNEAANKLEWFQKLIDDSTNDHFVDTLNFYLERCQKFEEDFMELVMKSEDICHYCKHDTECKGKECEKYCEGKRAYGKDGQHFPNWKWLCTDFDFGTCPLLENTPCNECFENNCKGFEWRGNV